jgi:acetyl-CoA acyltransferase
MAGVYDVVVAAGVEVMSTTPLGLSMLPGTLPFGPRVVERYGGLEAVSQQGISGELIADKWAITRDELDAYGARSQQLAEQATREGRFEREIVPVKARLKDRDSGDIVDLDELVTADECIRPGTTTEILAGLKPAFKPEGKLTAGNSSQISDGAAAVLIMSEERASALRLRPRARFHAFALAGADPVMMLTGPIPATGKVLERAKLGVEDMDAVEINEAFASVVLAWEKEVHPDMAKVNPNGGAIALGHPLGCSGAKLMTTLLNELERSGGRFGLQTICEGGGLANATIIERLG